MNPGARKPENRSFVSIVPWLPNFHILIQQAAPPGTVSNNSAPFVRFEELRINFTRR